MTDADYTLWECFTPEEAEAVAAGMWASEKRMDIADHATRRSVATDARQGSLFDVDEERGRGGQG